MNEQILCPMCEENRDFRRETVREEYEVRGEKIALDIPRLICAACGESLIDEAFGDPTLHVYSEYRRRHGLLTPAQIRAIREKYGLSQGSFATLLGTSPATLARYEGGSLQDKAYDQLLRACENPAYMADLVRREGDHLSPLQRRNVVSALQNLQLNSEPDAAGLAFNFALYAAVVCWFARRFSSIPQTKIYKLLFYTDFMSFEEFGSSLTGSMYKRLPYGPVPCNYGFLQSQLEAQGVIEIAEVFYPSCVGLDYRPGPGAQAATANLSVPDIRLLEFVADTFGGMTAKAISDRSHQESAWLETPPSQIISYEHAHRLSVKLPART